MDGLGIAVGFAFVFDSIQDRSFADDLARSLFGNLVLGYGFRFSVFDLHKSLEGDGGVEVACRFMDDRDFGGGVLVAFDCDGTWIVAGLCFGAGARICSVVWIA